MGNGGDKLDRGKILIVNSDLNTRKDLRDGLVADYEIEISENLEDALKKIRDVSFNIVVTEISVPEIKGIEVVRKFKELKSELPVIVVTSYDSVPLAVEAMKAGAYDYITKPFNIEELKMVILHALELKKLEEEVKEKRIYQELALLDGLTGIYNRRYFDELLRREIDRATRYPQEFSLLFIDVDDLKKYNDTYGHLAGDNVLRNIALFLFKRTRITDYVARFGGDEYAVIAPNTNKRGASVLAARILGLVDNQEISLPDSKKTHVTISIGIAEFPADAKTQEGLIKCADDALYQAKKLGRNRVCMFGNL